MDGQSQVMAELVAAVRSEDVKLQGEMLRRYEPLLKLVARVHMESRLRRKFDPSDIVQQTLLQAFRGLPEFRGRTEREFVAWLKKILSNALGHEIRRWRGAQKRKIVQERELDCRGPDTTQGIYLDVPGAVPSPSGVAIQREHEVILAEAIDQLPSDYREVVILRSMLSLSHDDVAERMGKTPGAVRMLWIRALAELRKVLKHKLSGATR